MTETISETDFVNVWGAGAKEDGNLYQYEDVKNADCRFVWTVVESGGEDDNWYAVAGFYVVNKLGYVLTVKPWETGLEQAMWVESLDDDEPEQEGERQKLIDFLMEDWQNSIASSGFPVVQHILLNGHTGYLMMPIKDLRREAEDSGYEPDEEGTERPDRDCDPRCARRFQPAAECDCSRNQGG